jgi:hypothetical protein
MIANPRRLDPTINDFHHGLLTFHAVPTQYRHGRYELTVPIAFDRVMSAVVPEVGELHDRMTSPMPGSWNHFVPWLRAIDQLRRAA